MLKERRCTENVYPITSIQSRSVAKAWCLLKHKDRLSSGASPDGREHVWGSSTDQISRYTMDKSGTVECIPRTGLWVDNLNSTSPRHRWIKCHHCRWKGVLHAPLISLCRNICRCHLFWPHRDPYLHWLGAIFYIKEKSSHVWEWYSHSYYTKAEWKNMRVLLVINTQPPSSFWGVLISVVGGNY